MAARDTRASADDRDAPPWAGLIALAGAATGLTALVYFVGAVTMWARFRAAGLPADVAIEHHSRAALLAVGVRGVLAIIAIVAAVLAAGYWAARASRTVRRLAALARARGLAAALVLLGVIGLLSWRWLGVAIAVVGALAGLAWWVGERAAGRTRPSLALVVVVLVAAAVAAVGWQVQAPVRVQTVAVAPLPGESLEGVLDEGLAGTPLPYFGQTAGFVYVAEAGAESLGGGPTRILELPRDRVLLAFPSEKAELYPRLSSPWRSLWRALGRSL